MATESLFLSDFKGGLVTEPPTYRLDANQFPELFNLELEPWGGITLRKSQRVVKSQPTYQVTGIWRTAAGLLFYSLSDGNYYTYNENTATQTLIHTGGGNGVTLFSEFGGYVFFTLSTGGVMASPSTGGASISVGVAAPVTAPAVANGGAGLLDTTNLAPYRYYVTFVNATGGESNPSPISDGMTGTLFQTNLTSIPTGGTGIVSRRIYRQGGYLSRPTFIHTIADNVTTTYADNIPDKNVGTVQMSFSRDVPPTDAIALVAAKGRLILANRTTLFVSNLGDYNAFPLVVTYRRTDGFQFMLDGDLSSDIRNICSAASAIFIARRRDCWILQGQDTDSWSPQRVAMIGCGAPRSLVSCEGAPVWVGNDGMVWIYLGGKPQPLGLPIRSLLRGVSNQYLPLANGCYFQRQYHICFPQSPYGPALAGAKYFVYDFNTNCWYDFSAGYSATSCMYADTESQTDGEIFFGQYAATNLPDNSPVSGTGASLFTSNWLPFAITSADLDMGMRRRLKKIDKIRVRGVLKIRSGAAAAQLVLTAITDKRDGTTAVATQSFSLNPGAVSVTTISGVLLDTDVPASIQGHRIKWRISGEADTFELHDVELNYTDIRDGVN